MGAFTEWLNDFLYSFVLGYAIQIFFAVGIMALPLKRRKWGWVRIIGGYIPYFYVTLGLQYVSFYYLPINMTTLFVLICEFAYLMFCYDVPYRRLLFCVFAGSLVQQIAYNLSSFYRIAVNFEVTILNSSVVIGIYIIIFILAYFLLARRIKYNLVDMDNKYLLVTSLFVVVIILGLNLIMVYSDYVWNKLVRLYATVSSVFALFIQFMLFRQNNFERDEKMMEHIISQQQKQYKISKETIDLINIKCHDLKFYIDALRSEAGKEFSEEALDEVAKFDAIIKTGNEVLDVIFTEKSLICESRKIKFNCMAGAEKFDFINKSDLFALFDNALENAIESVLKEKDEEKRIINVQVYDKSNCLFMHIDNYCGQEVVFADGFPVTDKKDKLRHGYGVKSIKYIVDKYKGQIMMEWQDKWFHLNVIIPMNA